VKGGPGSSRKSGERLSAIADQIARRDDAGERGADGSTIDLRLDRVERRVSGRGRPGAGHCPDKGPDVWPRSPLSRPSRQIGPSALEGFENEGLVRVDDSAQSSRLIACEGAEKSMRKAMVG
jgi:hypothetical protein